MATKKYTYTFNCPCGNTINRNYLGNGSTVTCRKCGKSARVIKFAYCEPVLCWPPNTKVSKITANDSG